MKSPLKPPVLSVPAHVEELDDAALRSGHALLDTRRAHDFAHWLDAELTQLESRFRQFTTPQAARRSLGR